MPTCVGLNLELMISVWSLPSFLTSDLIEAGSSLKVVTCPPMPIWLRIASSALVRFADRNNEPVSAPCPGPWLTSLAVCWDVPPPQALTTRAAATAARPKKLLRIASPFRDQVDDGATVRPGRARASVTFVSTQARERVRIRFDGGGHDRRPRR